MSRYLSLCLLVLSVLACSNSSQPKFYGKEFDTTRVISVNDLAQRMEGTARVEAIVEGKVTTVCKVQGCWMNLENPGGEDIFVDWDHAFEVPKNADGRTAIIKGYAFYDTTSVEKLKHFAEDEGKSQEEIDKITEPKFQLTIKATGVVL